MMSHSESSMKSHPHNKRKGGNVGFDNKTPGAKRPKIQGLEKQNYQENTPVQGINISHFAESRAVEVQALTEIVKDVGGNHQAFQKLPRHMRRRAMSHNIKRVPRRLHATVKTQLEKVKKSNKCPSRYHRRRPKNLLSEFERRKRKISWLETHIWHAKRFKMMQKWDMWIAHHPNDKSVRACYRAVRRHCLIQDVSYESYIEVKGDRDDIIGGLAHLTNVETGLTFASKMSSAGLREGSVVLYHYDCYPCNAIGKVTFIWRPDSSVQTSPHSTLWICCHPSFFNEAFEDVKKCFNQSVVPVAENHAKKEDGAKNESENTSQVQVASLKDQLVKFRLFGPASNAVLAEVMKPFHRFRNSKSENGNAIKSSNNDHMRAKDTSDTCGMPWWKDFCSEEEKAAAWSEQIDVWSKVMSSQSPAEVPPHAVLAMTVGDPRLLIPPRRNKFSLYNTGSKNCPWSSTSFTTNVSDSPLWDANVRSEVKATKLPEQTINNLKSQVIVPGTPLVMGEKESFVPAIFIQRPGVSVSAYGSTVHLPQGFASGWDILLPAGWAMAFWVALIYRGARVCGQREARSIGLQAGQLVDIDDLPDTAAGKSEAKAEAEKRQIAYNKRPPAKRPNFTKLGFEAPFTFSFKNLSQEWIPKIQELLKTKLPNLSCVSRHDIYVLRKRQSLFLLKQALLDKREFLKSKFMKNVKKAPQKKDFNFFNTFTDSEAVSNLIQQHSNALVPVTFNLHCKGTPASHGHICLPSAEDLKSFGENQPFGGPVEYKHQDPNKKKRKEERKQKLRQRKKKKKKQDETKADSENGSTSDQTCVSVSSNTCLSNIEDEHLQPVDHTARPMIGYITKGDFNLGQGHGSGMGFCSVASLLYTLAQQEGRRNCVVLVRNPTSFQYRFASLSVTL